MNKPSRLFWVAVAVVLVPMMLRGLGYRLPAPWDMVTWIAGIGILAIDQTILFFRTLYGPRPLRKSSSPRT